MAPRQRRGDGAAAAPGPGADTAPDCDDLAYPDRDGLTADSAAVHPTFAGAVRHRDARTAGRHLDCCGHIFDPRPAASQTATSAATRSPTPTRPPPTFTPTPPPTALPPAVRLTGLTHAWQTWNNCGPATLAMNLSYFGSRATQAEVAATLRPFKDDKNVNPEELAAYARAQGFRALVRVNGSPETLRQLLSAGVPVLIETWYEPKPNDGMGHYRLLVGFDDAAREWIAYDSYDSHGLVKGQPYAGIRLPYAEVARDWPVFNRTYLLIYDEARAAAVEQSWGMTLTTRPCGRAPWPLPRPRSRQQPDDPFAWFNLGTDLTALGRFDEAASAYDRARQLGLPWRMLWYQFGPFRAYYETGRYDEVIALADATLRTAKHVEELFFWRGLAQQAQGRPARGAGLVGAGAGAQPELRRRPGRAGCVDPMTDATSVRRRHIARNVLLVAAAFTLAAAVGLLRNMIIAQTFGIGAELDAYYAAFKLPDLLFSVVAGGALATAFIPVFAGFAAADDRTAAWRLASAITNWVVLITGALAALAALFSPWLVRILIAPGFDPALQAETAAVMRLVLISTVIFAVSAVQGSVLNGFKHFLLPALAPVVYPLGVIAGALWLAPRWGVAGLAAGAVIGSALHLGIKVPGLIRFGFRWRPILDARNPAVRQVARLMGPRVLDLGVFHLTLVATTNLASRLGPGRVSALEWGWDAMQLPETIIGTAFGLVVFPTLADLAARRDQDGLRRTLGESLRTVLALAIPASVALILLGRPLLALLYQRGEFDAAATEMVYVALRFYALGLAAHACLELVARAFFAGQDTVTPLYLAIASAAASIGLGIVLMQPLDYAGLALANSLAVTGEVIALLLILRRRWGGVEGRQTLATLGRVLAASLVMGGAIILVTQSAERAGLGWLSTVAAGGIAGIAAYLLAARLLGVREIDRFVSAVFGRSRAV